MDKEEGVNLKGIYVIALLMTYITGFAGYYSGAGEGVLDAAYHALQLFFLEYPEPAIANIGVEVARWISPLLTATAVLLALKDAVKRMGDSIRAMIHRDATVIYCDDENTDILKENISHGIFLKSGTKRFVDEYIFMLSKDEDNLRMYENMRNVLADKKVYMKLTEIDSFLMEKTTIQFFSLNEIIARKYWQERHLLKYMKDGKMRVKIAIIGFDPLGEKILNYGLLNNIYSLDQCIEYHIWGNSDNHHLLCLDFDMMNGDKVICHENTWKKDIQMFREFDRVIVSDDVSIALIEALLYQCTETEIDYYNPSDADFRNIYESEQIYPFGRTRDIFTESNIKSDEMYRLAKELNYGYACLYGGEKQDDPMREQKMTEAWNNLDGFVKGSNIAAADYHMTRLQIMKTLHINPLQLSEKESDMLSCMEHIRWARYHYVNHWKYGEPKDKQKSKMKRIHKCLVPFDELSEDNKSKDLEMIQVLLSIYSGEK